MRKEPSMCLYVCVCRICADCRELIYSQFFTSRFFPLSSPSFILSISLFSFDLCVIFVYLFPFYFFFFFVNSWFRRTDVLLFSMCVSYSYAICCIRFECVYRAGCGCWVSLSLHVVACAFAITLNFSETERSSESLLCQSFILITKEKEKEKN